MELLITLDRTDKRPLQVQLYEEMRRLILGGSLKAGQRVPSSRQVAEQLGIARNTAVLAYERLMVEGYVTSRVRAGIFVNEQLPDVAVLVRNKLSPPTEGDVRPGKISPFSGRAPELWREPSVRPKLDLFVGRPHGKSFPMTFWRRSAARHLVRSGTSQTQYGDPCGLLRLRQAIADHLKATRGISASPEQIVITGGIQGALNLLARIFLHRRRYQRVAVENPCYQGAAFLFLSYGARLHPIDVDTKGLIVSQLDRFSGSLLYVTPSHQFPTGYTLSLDRRLHLLEWAYRTGTYVVEDDYDSDFRYDGPPLTALAGLDRHECVIYLGTFSKSIGAGMRLGYAVLPTHLVEPVKTVKALSDHGSQWLEQAVVADFIQQGEFLRHLRRIRKLYLATRDTLIEAIHEHFPGSVLSGTESGMHMMWHLPDVLPDATTMHRRAAAVDVGLYGLHEAATYEFKSHARFGERSLVLGYAALSPDEIREAIGRVATALEVRRRSESV